MKHIFLFLAALLASLCMSVAKTTYTYKLVRTDFYSKEPYVYPNKNGTYYFTIVLNPTPPNGTSGIGNYNLTVENGKFQYTGNNAWNGVAEGANIEVIFDDVSTQYGIIKIATAQSKDTANVLQAGDTIQRSYAIASLKGKTPDITLSNSNPSMGSIQPITVISLNDMEFQGIYISNGFGGSTTLKVEDYEWILPSGWQTSKGNKGTFTLNVSDSKNISIIPDLFTIGEFKVRGMNTLKSAGSDYKTFTMDRGFRFTSYPTSITFGDNTTRTFSVAAFPGLAYEWSVPAGWQINSGQGTNTVSITPGFCSVPNDKIKVRLKSGSTVSDWLNCPTQIATPYFSSSSSTVNQYGCLTLTLQNIDLSKIQSVSISNNVSVISNQGADYTILFPATGNVQVTASVLLKDCTTPITVSTYITVNPPQFSITGPGFVCYGSNATFILNNFPACATTTSWSVSGQVSIVSQSNNSVTVSPTSPEPFTADLTAKMYQNGNLISTTVKSFSANTANFNINGPASILALQSGSYTANASPGSCSLPSTGVNYEWRINGALVETSPNVTIQSVQGGASTSSAMSTNTGSKNKVVLNGDSMTVNQPITTPINNIELSVTIKNSSGKLFGSASMQVTIYGDYKVVSKALSPPAPIAMNVYPNPVSGILNIETGEDGNTQSAAKQQTATDAKPLKKDITREVRLYDGHGKLLLHTKTKDSHAHLNVSHLHNGIYYLHIYDGVSDKPEIRQIMVKH